MTPGMPGPRPLLDRLRDRRVHYLLAAAGAFLAAPVLTLLLPRPLPNAPPTLATVAAWDDWLRAVGAVLVARGLWPPREPADGPPWSVRLRAWLRRRLAHRAAPTMPPPVCARRVRLRRRPRRGRTER